MLKPDSRQTAAGIVLLLLAFCTSAVLAQGTVRIQDPGASDPLSARDVYAETLNISSNIDDSHSPRGALWRSAALPGWGQIYNEQYYKLPFVYGALGALAYSAVTRHDDYVLYREAFQYKAYQELVDSGSLESNPKASLKGAYDQVAEQFGPVSSSPLRVQRNNFRRSRDLSMIGCGFVYGLAMLDAFVSAHLLDFDVGEDLAITVLPSPGGVRISTRIPMGQ